jgi:orotidine-5'-phosphate decarboxylase
MRFSRYRPSILPMAGSLAIVGARRYHGVMPMDFAERLARAQQSSGSLVCVGLDPDLAKLPKDLGAGDPASGAAPVYAFNRRIVDATADIAAAYKPQVAFYSALGAEEQLVASIRYIRERAPHALVILDGKRNDIGNTAEAYVHEAFDRYGADAVTVNPYMGEDSVRPFLARPDRGAILLCRTSNPGGRDFQDLLIDGLPLYRRVAEHAAAHWNERGNLMLVVGATCPREMAELRRAHPELSFLVPGIGAQGGDLEATLAAGLNARGAGLLISSSRNIIYAGGGAAGSIRAAAAELYTAINKHRPRTLEGALDGAAIDPQCRAVGRGG